MEIPFSVQKSTFVDFDLNMNPYFVAGIQCTKENSRKGIIITISSQCDVFLYIKAADSH